ncbi:MAG TPA: ATP-binding protein [Mycobacteriales bacterium]
MSDPFGTAAVRDRVLAAWTASPARFREDANAEQDLTHGAYRDRLLVELAQNAADAAARAGVPGRLRLSLVDGSLCAANTGAPLDRAGAEALATLRASAKRDGDSVGRFGVGFAAVLTVTDAPSVLSTSGGIRFSADRTRAVVAEVPALAAELRRRSGQVPVLRLPWPADPLPPGDWDTEVRLPLRPDVVDAVRAALSTLDPVLLLALPALRSIDADGRLLTREDDPAGSGGPVGRPESARPEELRTVVLRDGAASSRWVVRSASGLLPADLLASRPAEERDRPEWTVSWAVPVSPAGLPVAPATRPVVHAPTPTDEALSLPAVLLGTFSLSSDRRHVVPGPVTDLLVAAAAAAYAELVAGLPPAPAVLDLVPRPQLAAAELDAALAHAVLAALRTTAWLPLVAAEEPVDRVRPGDAVVVDAAVPDLVDALADLVPGLLPADWSGRGRAAALTALGVRRLSTADVVELVAGADRPPPWWRALYAALADRPDRESLAALPVPLADGRTVTGARGVLLPDADLPAAAASALGLRIVHPDAAHPLLVRLGATPATARGVLADERVLAAAAESYDEEDPEPVAEAVLALVRGARLGPGEIPELAELALRARDGEWYPAGELLLPGSPLATVVADDAPFETVADDLLDRYGPDTLAAVGVLRTFAVVRTGELDLDPDAADHDLDGEAEWREAVLDRFLPQPVPPRLAAFTAVRDLDLVADWERAIPLLTGTSPTVEVQLADGSHRTAPSYTTWWLSTHRTLGGRRPDRLRTPDATDLEGLYDPAPGDPDTLALLGVAAGLDDVLADPDRALDLLDRLGDPARTVPPAILPTIYARLALVLGDAAEPPDRVRTAPGTTVPRAEAVVLDRPYLLPLLTRTPVPAGAAAGPVADLLDLPTASELLGDPVPAGEPRRRRPWADVPGAALAAARCGAAVPDAVVVEHDALTAGGVPVGWWPAGRTDHTDGSPDALGRALAWRLGAWPARAAAAEALRHPGDEALAREDALG